MTDVPAAPDRDPERLVRAYADLVLRVCYTYLRSMADAEDVCQDTFIKLVCREEPFRDLDHERAWVVRVASNACKTLLRDRGAHPEVNLDEVPEPPSGDAVDERALRRRDGRVLDAVMALPLPQREAVFLHYYAGYGARAISELAGVSENAVHQRLSRARAQLRETLKGDYDEFPA